MERYAMLCGILMLVASASASSFQGYVSTEEDFEMMASYCFEEGSLSYHFMYPTSYATQKILMYSHDNWMWYEDCPTRVGMLSYDNGEILDLHPDNFMTDCKEVYYEGQMQYNCTGEKYFPSTGYPRLWYFAVARCDKSKGGMSGLRLQYNMHFMMNGHSDLPTYMCEEMQVASAGTNTATAFVLLVSQLFVALFHALRN